MSYKVDVETLSAAVRSELARKDEKRDAKSTSATAEK
jgi:hypothetical protein